jgi:Domain of unknown function (DUF4304)
MTNEVQIAFDALGKAAGMAKWPDNWYRSSDDMIVVVNLQKSEYGPSDYVNVGWWLRILGDAKFPKEYPCQFIRDWKRCSRIALKRSRRCSTLTRRCRAILTGHETSYSRTYFRCWTVRHRLMDLDRCAVTVGWRERL